MPESTKLPAPVPAPAAPDDPSASSMAESPPSRPSHGHEVPVWRRWLFPGLALVATMAALGAFWAARQSGTVGTDRGRPADATAGPAFVGAVVQPPADAPPFTLPTASGGTFELADARGRVVVLFFGFTSCPDVCPNTLTQLAVALGALGDDASRVIPVFVSVDPDRDTPAFVTRFLRGYDDRLVGLVPDEGQLGDVTGRYGVVYGKEFPEGAPETGLHYTMSHTASLFLIDPRGRLRSALIPPYTPGDIVHDVRLLLDERG